MFEGNERLHQIMYDRLGVSWYEQLKSFIDSETFTILRNRLLDDCDNNVVYPSAMDAYRAFKLAPHSRVKVVIIGQDPYHDGSANGLCFSTKGKMTPSLRVILKAMSEELSPIHRYRSPEFADLASQGVLLLNTALSVKAGQAGSHLSLWEPFFKEVKEKLFARDRLIWMLWGMKAINAVGEVPDKHVVFKTVHPAATIYDTKNIFKPGFNSVNEQLKKWNELPIDWMAELDDLPF